MIDDRKLLSFTVLDRSDIDLSSINDEIISTSDIHMLYYRPTQTPYHTLNSVVRYVYNNIRDKYDASDISYIIMSHLINYNIATHIATGTDKWSRQYQSEIENNIDSLGALLIESINMYLLVDAHEVYESTIEVLMNDAGIHRIAMDIIYHNSLHYGSINVPIVRTIGVTTTLFSYFPHVLVLDYSNGRLVYQYEGYAINDIPV